MKCKIIGLTVLIILNMLFQKQKPARQNRAKEGEMAQMVVERWKAFLNEVLPDKSEQTEFVRLFRKAITGSPAEFLALNNLGRKPARFIIEPILSGDRISGNLAVNDIRKVAR